MCEVVICSLTLKTMISIKGSSHNLNGPQLGSAGLRWALLSKVMLAKAYL